MKNILFVFLLCTFFLCTKAQPPKKFMNCFGGNGYDVAYDVKQTLDKGYIIIGSTSSFGGGNTDMYLVKLDSMGHKKIETSFGGYNNEIGKSVIQLSDSSYVVAGYTNSSGFGGYDIYLVKTDKTGVPLWQKTLGGSDWDFANSIQETLDGGLIIAGTTYSYGRGNADGYVIKTDAGGNIQWTKTYGGKYNDEFKSVIQTADGGYALTGYSKSYADTTFGDIWSFKLDAAGDSLWCRFYGGIKEDFGNEIIEHQNGTFFIAGGTTSYGLGQMDGYTVKTDNNGNQLGDMTDGTAGNDEFFNSIVFSKRDPNIVTVIEKESFVGYSLQIKIMEVSLNFNYINATDYGSVANDELYKIIATKDKGYACVGYSYGYSSILTNCYIIKIDSTLAGGNSSIVSVPEILSNEMHLSIFPNPASETLTINSDLEINPNEIHFLDVTGKDIYTNIQKSSFSGHQLMLYLQNITAGMYYLKYGNMTYKISVIH